MDKEYDLAMQAGLADGGKDEDGFQLYIGSDAQWNKFEKLREAELIKRGIPDFNHTYEQDQVPF